MASLPSSKFEEARRWRTLEVEAYILGMLGELVDLAVENQLSGTIGCVAVCQALVAEIHKERVAHVIA